MGFAYFLDPKTKAGLNMYAREETIHQLKMFMDDRREHVGGGFEVMHDNEFHVRVTFELTSFESCVVNAQGAAESNIQEFDSITWWMAIGQEKFPLLYKLASRLFSVQTSSAASERVWSTYDLVQSRRHSEKKSTDLIFLYANSAIEPQEADYASLFINMDSSETEDDE